MRQMRTMAAGAIRALPHAVPVKNGTAAVGGLLPVRNLSPEPMRTALADIGAAPAMRLGRDRRRPRRRARF
ncbi:hypothetical protein FF100_31045 [Methylobacterium terricola]|uniref:Uncharacterized protein n=1 Tax=Methylobacterium terricola TaxID=2583531 RepID=A0A5C4L8F9_9HYPH|nr:hypothetical protein [Methylobacterium terricola]TNC07881.1 hypothetical protein FF100_31045 [Methylobacterium terricola]